MTRSAPRFSLGFLFRATTCAAILLTWGASITTVPPDRFLFGMIGGGTILGIVVGYRRAGTLLTRAKALASCVGWAFAAGFFSALIALWFQESGIALSDIFRSTNPAGWFACFISVAIVFYSFVMLLREWTWSAHDAQLRREQAAANDEPAA